MKLIPVDMDQCQTMKPSSNTFMTFGGVPGLVRCENNPTHILTEIESDIDGLIGKMSVCSECLEKFKSQVKNAVTHQVTIEEIKV
jgi:hypothetical protein